MQGIFINGVRPKSKKEIKEHIAKGLAAQVSLEATSPFGREHNGPVTEMPEDKIAYFVGPDPHTRNFYGQVTRRGSKVKVT